MLEVKCVGYGGTEALESVDLMLLEGEDVVGRLHINLGGLDGVKSAAALRAAASILSKEKSGRAYVVEVTGERVIEVEKIVYTQYVAESVSGEEGVSGVVPA